MNTLNGIVIKLSHNPLNSKSMNTKQLVAVIIITVTTAILMCYEFNHSRNSRKAHNTPIKTIRISELSSNDVDAIENAICCVGGDTIVMLIQDTVTVLTRPIEVPGGTYFMCSENNGYWRLSDDLIIKNITQQKHTK